MAVALLFPGGGSEILTLAACGGGWLAGCKGSMVRGVDVWASQSGHLGDYFKQSLKDTIFGRTQILKNSTSWLSAITFEVGFGTSMTGNPMGLILTS